jgi:hypothetical protein
MRRATYIYFIAPVGGGRIKIGVSTQPIQRLMNLSYWSPVPLEILATVSGTIRDEGHIHYLFKDAWSHHEWFNPCAAIWALIADIRQLGRLPDYAVSTGPVENIRTALGIRIYKPSQIRTPEWRKRHGDMMRRAWAKKRASASAPQASAA